MGAAGKGGEEEREAKGLHGQYVPHVGCGLNYKHWLGMCDAYVMHVEVWGAAEGVEEEGEAEGSTQLICAARILWVRLKASVRCMLCLCNAHGGLGAMAEGFEEEGEAEGLHGQYALHTGCGLNYNHH